MTRKRRNDRNHVLYMLTSPKGRYIGVTYVRGRAFKGSCTLRWKAHCANARVLTHDTLLSRMIREVGEKGFYREVLEVVRGKRAAHARETELIKKLSPELNMESMGRKAPRRAA